MIKMTGIVTEKPSFSPFSLLLLILGINLRSYNLRIIDSQRLKKKENDRENAFRGFIFFLIIFLFSPFLLFSCKRMKRRRKMNQEIENESLLKDSGSCISFFFTFFWTILFSL